MLGSREHPVPAQGLPKDRLDMHKGPWVVLVGDRTRVVTVKSAHDGGMVEFLDAVTGEPAGCAGVHWFMDPANKVRYEGRLPVEPEPGRWIGGRNGR